jgi:hypothetical protein
VAWNTRNYRYVGDVPAGARGGAGERCQGQRGGVAGARGHGKRRSQEGGGAARQLLQAALGQEMGRAVHGEVGGGARRARRPVATGRERAGEDEGIERGSGPGSLGERERVWWEDRDGKRKGGGGFQKMAGAAAGVWRGKNAREPVVEIGFAGVAELGRSWAWRLAAGWACRPGRLGDISPFNLF